MPAKQNCFRIHSFGRILDIKSECKPGIQGPYIFTSTLFLSATAAIQTSTFLQNLICCKRNK
jgi:hypothetical protein